MRKPAGQVKIRNATRRRIEPFVMGGIVRVAPDEWVEAISITRPVRVSSGGLPVVVMPTAPMLMDFLPGQLSQDLKFNRLEVRFR
jgi:hypothetical protein